MIDVECEALIPLREVGSIIPSSRYGKRLNFATIWRWAMHGARGRRLEAVKLGGSLYTSREAISRFAEHVTGSDTPTSPAPAVRSPAQRQRDQERAAKMLDEAGIV
jgi:hypothetical protein